MKKRYYAFLIIIPFILILIFNVDVVLAVENAMADDVILGEEGFANKAEKFTKIIPYVVIVGLILSSYVYYKKSK